MCYLRWYAADARQKGMERMSNCGTCKSWGLPHEIEKAEAFRSCVRVPHDTTMPKLSDPAEEAEGHFEAMDAEESEREAYRAEKARTLAVVVDGELYFAALRTSETFGCVLHELAEEKGAAE